MKRWFDARPHPDPLPRGEGTATERLLLFGRSSRQPSRWLPSETAHGSPSPGGEGRGEGERCHILITNLRLLVSSFLSPSESGAEATAVQTLRVHHAPPDHAERLDCGAFTAAFRATKIVQPCISSYS
jgi:hypothetical protein